MYYLLTVLLFVADAKQRDILSASSLSSNSSCSSATSDDDNEAEFTELFELTADFPFEKFKLCDPLQFDSFEDIYETLDQPEVGPFWTDVRGRLFRA